MKVKLIIVGIISEQHVASFRTLSEALHCGSLLSASTEDENLIYYVEFTEKGKKVRLLVDSFIRRLPFLNKITKELLENYYNKSV